MTLCDYSAKQSNSILYLDAIYTNTHVHIHLTLSSSLLNRWSEQHIQSLQAFIGADVGFQPPIINTDSDDGSQTDAVMGKQ